VGYLEILRNSSRSSMEEKAAPLIIFSQSVIYRCACNVKNVCAYYVALLVFSKRCDSPVIIRRFVPHGEIWRFISCVTRVRKIDSYIHHGEISYANKSTFQPAGRAEKHPCEYRWRCHAKRAKERGDKKNAIYCPATSAS